MCLICQFFSILAVLFVSYLKNICLFPWLQIYSPALFYKLYGSSIFAQIYDSALNKYSLQNELGFEKNNIYIFHTNIQLIQ